MKTHFIDLEAHEKYQEAVTEFITNYSLTIYHSKPDLKRALLELHELYNRI